MAVCEICGNSIPDARRSSRRFCSARCRKVASRRTLAAQKKAQSLTMTLEGAAMVQKLRKVLPKTAASVEAFIEENGVGCAEAAVKLVLTAYAEARSAAKLQSA